MKAARSSKLDAIKMLLDKGADMEHEDEARIPAYVVLIVSD